MCQATVKNTTTAPLLTTGVVSTKSAKESVTLSVLCSSGFCFIISSKQPDDGPQRRLDFYADLQPCIKR